MLLVRVAGARLPGLQAPAAATTVSAPLYLPVAVILLVHGRLHGEGILYVVGAGILSSAGLLLLGQVLCLHEWLGIAIVVAANAGATVSGGTRRTWLDGGDR